MFYTVDTGTEFGKLSLAVIDGRPAIAYNDGNDCRYAICSDSDGSGEWSLQTFASGFANTTMPRLTEVSGGPAVLVTSEGAAPGHRSVSLMANESPDATGEWQCSTISPVYGGQHVIPSLLLASGRPAAVFPVNYGVGTKLEIAVNTQADGLGLWTISDVELAPVEERMAFGRFTSAALIGRLPAVAYHCYPVDDYGQRADLHFAINPATDGSGEWSVRTVEVGDDGIVYAHWPSLAEVDGRPAIAYDRCNNIYFPPPPEPIAWVKYAINTKSDGSGYWNRFTVDSAGWCCEASLRVVGQRPAIAYMRGSELHASDFVLVYAENSAIDGTGAWTYHVVDDNSPAGRSPSLVVIDGRPAIAYRRWRGEPSSREYWLIFAIRDY